MDMELERAFIFFGHVKILSAVARILESKRPFGAVCVCQKTKHIFVDKYHVGLEDDL